MLMLKYDHQLTEVKTRFPNASRILIVLPQNLNVDNLGAGLALYLSLKNTGKKVDIVSTGTPLVSQSNLFGIGDIKNEVSKAGAGNFVISLDGVVDNTGTMQQVPALEKLDWYPEGTKLNLVFHVVPGQRFEPTNITSKHEETGYDLTFVVGCQSLNELGNLFISNSQYFAQSQVVNIDINSLNAYFGFANVIDPQASSISEIVAHILPSLTLSMDQDTASNIIAGIYAATSNLTQKVNPDTFLAVSQAVQVGGTLPNMPSSTQTAPAQPEVNIDYQPQVAEQPAQPVQNAAPTQDVSQPAPEPQAQTYTPEIQQPVTPVQVVPSAPSEVQTPSLQGSPFIVPPQDINIPIPTTPAPEPQFQFNQNSQMTDEQAQTIPTVPQGNPQGFDLRQIFQIPQMPSGSLPANPQNANTNPKESQQSVSQPQQSGGGNPEIYHEQPAQAQASAEERPMGEVATAPSPEIESTPTPDWLVPKIFKGGNLG